MRRAPFSALGRAVWDETEFIPHRPTIKQSFSALGRAVWDETYSIADNDMFFNAFSALGRAVWDETVRFWKYQTRVNPSFSALGRAVWDETPTCLVRLVRGRRLSVLSVEPYGMKRRSWISSPSL